MTIKQHGGVFGRNPKFNSVEAESLSIAGNAVPDASTILVDGDIGSTVQGYDANTAKTDESNVFTTAQKLSSAAPQLRFIETDQTDVNTKIGNVGGKFRIETMDDAETSFTARFLVDNTTGNAEITDGNLVISTSGKGIDFSATGDGSGTSSNELLADYEEGTWTPVYQTTGTAFDAITHSVQDGFYRKVGNLVVFNFFLRTSSVTVGSASGLLVVGGLPYTPANTRNPGGPVVTSFGWGVNAPRHVRASSSGYLFLSYDSAANRTADIYPSDLGAASNNDCYATGIYYT